MAASSSPAVTACLSRPQAKVSSVLQPARCGDAGTTRAKSRFGHIEVDEPKHILEPVQVPDLRHDCNTAL